VSFQDFEVYPPISAFLPLFGLRISLLPQAHPQEKPFGEIEVWMIPLKKEEP